MVLSVFETVFLSRTPGQTAGDKNAGKNLFHASLYSQIYNKTVDYKKSCILKKF